MVIYLITNQLNGKRYVGQTVGTIESRWKGHVNDSKRFNYPLGNAIRKYGAENFRIEVLVTATSLSDLNELETFYIGSLDTLKPRGYNLNGGGGNRRHHPDTRAKISAAKKGNKSTLGYKHTDATKAKISQANKGKRRTAEVRQRLSELRRGKKLRPDRKPRPLGLKHSEETKAKLSALRKGKKGNPHTQEFKDQLSQRNIGNTYNLGRKFPAEHRAKMSATASKRPRDAKGHFIAKNEHQSIRDHSVSL